MTTGPASVRLYDRIVSGRYPLAPLESTFTDAGAWAAAEQWTMREIQQCERIVADQIDEFVTANFTDPVAGTQTVDSYLLPNLIPPFPQLWIEWRVSDPYMRAKGFRLAGALVLCTTDKGAGMHGFEIRCFLDYERQHIFQITTAVMVASHIDTGDMSYMACVPDPQIYGLQREIAPGRSMASVLALSALTTVSFVNCRNVAMPWVQPPEKFARAYGRRTGKKLAPYRVIDIVPMSRFLSKQFGDERDPKRRAEMAFQTVRGHMKRYSDGAGLFGRHKGTFFFSAHDRGSADRKTRQGGYRIKFTGREKPK